MTDAPKTLDDNTLREAIGRAWCHEGNTHKVVDPDLAEAVLYEVRAALAEHAAAQAALDKWRTGE